MHFLLIIVITEAADDSTFSSVQNKDSRGYTGGTWTSTETGIKTLLSKLRNRDKSNKSFCG